MSKIIEEMRMEAFEEGRRIGMQEARQIEIQIGMQEAKKQAALRMLEIGKYPVEEICNICELSFDEVEKLKTEQAFGL